MRCVLKSRISRWGRGEGEGGGGGGGRREGAVGSVEVVDREGGEGGEGGGMVVNMWGDALEAHFGGFEVGKLYVISNGKVRWEGGGGEEDKGWWGGRELGRGGERRTRFVMDLSVFSVVREVEEGEGKGKGKEKEKEEGRVGGGRVYEYTRISNIGIEINGKKIHVVGVVVGVKVEGGGGGGGGGRRTVVIGDWSRYSIEVDVVGETGLEWGERGEKAKGRILVANYVLVTCKGGRGDEERRGGVALVTEWGSSIYWGDRLAMGRDLGRWLWGRGGRRVRWECLSDRAKFSSVGRVKGEVEKGEFLSGFFFFFLCCYCYYYDWVVLWLLPL